MAPVSTSTVPPVAFMRYPFPRGACVVPAPRGGRTTPGVPTSTRGTPSVCSPSSGARSLPPVPRRGDHAGCFPVLTLYGLPVALTSGARRARALTSGACCFGVLPAPAWRVNIEGRNGRGACTPGVSLFRLTVPPFTTSSVAREHRGAQRAWRVYLPVRHCSGSRFPSHSCAGVCSGRTTSPRSRSGHGCNVAGHCSGSRAGGQAFPRVRVCCSGVHPVYSFPARALTSTTHGGHHRGRNGSPVPDATGVAHGSPVACVVPAHCCKTARRGASRCAHSCAGVCSGRKTARRNP